MRRNATISLFPFLSVLVCTMGVLSFLSVMFMLATNTTAGRAPEPQKPVEVGWIGAPPHVRPILIECQRDGVMIHGVGAQASRFIGRPALSREAAIVRRLREDGLSRMGILPGDAGLWIYFKTILDQERRLEGSLTQALHRVEMNNLTGEGRKKREEHYPILLVYPDGVDTYDEVSFLVETTTRLATGVEPMLKGWSLPHRRRPS